MEKKINVPKKGAGRKWAKRLKELGEQRPPKDLMDILNQPEEIKKVARPRTPATDAEA